jgi:aldehyde:ferredoxin oxidoreductase
MPTGFHNRLLWIDLSAACVETRPLDEAYTHDFVGGSGLAVRYLYDLIDADVDPLDPQNPLIMMAGPLTGTRAPLTGRHAVVARSPLTGLLGESHMGGFFGATLRHAGYDGMVVVGQAAEPVWLAIAPYGAGDEPVALLSAQDLWGLDALETTAEIQRRLDNPRARTAAIGPAGENLVRYAAIVDERGRVAARTGLGAVMGSKRLKAIAVHADGRRDPPLADAERLTAIARQIRDDLKEDVVSQVLHATGTGGNLDYLYYLGALPIRYYTQGEWEGAAAISGNTVAETILTGAEGCYGCPVACGRRVCVPNGPYATEGEIKGAEYESLGALGSLLLIDDLHAVTHLAHLCDRLGLDTISAGNAIGLAIHLYEQGILDRDQADGRELRWGDPGLVDALLRDIAARRGLGARLAEGASAFAAGLGVAEEAVQINGMAPAMHDPRAYSGIGLVYATSPVGASHNQSAYYWVESGRALEELGIATPGAQVDTGKAAHVARDQDWGALLNALVMCLFANAPETATIDLLNAATGRDLNTSDALLLGERIFTLKRLLNLCLGYTPAGERLPRLLRRALAGGGTGGFVPDQDLLLDEYYAARDWDRATGWPSPHKLERLGLTSVTRPSSSGPSPNEACPG